MKKSKFKDGDKLGIPKKRFLSLQWLKQKIWLRYYPVALINMELRNGDHETFVRRADAQSFSYSGGNYVFDNDLKYFHSSSGLFAFDYHQDFSMPIKRTIPVNKIRATIKSTAIGEVEYATNPMTLEQFLISKIAEGIMKGQQIDDYLRQMKMILVITCISSVLMLALFVLKSGMLQSVKIPGLG